MIRYRTSIRCCAGAITNHRTLILSLKSKRATELSIPASTLLLSASLPAPTLAVGTGFRLWGAELSNMEVIPRILAEASDLSSSHFIWITVNPWAPVLREKLCYCLYLVETSVHTRTNTLPHFLCHWRSLTSIVCYCLRGSFSPCTIKTKRLSARSQHTTYFNTYYSSLLVRLF